MKSLAEKDCHYIKADKGNSSVILDKEIYDERVINTINEGNYKIVKSPLPKVMRETNDIIGKYKHALVYCYQRRKLVVPAPRVPLLYGLPKEHKPGYAMILISSNILSATYEINKFCIEKFKNFVQTKSFSVKNSSEFVGKSERY